MKSTSITLLLLFSFLLLSQTGKAQNEILPFESKEKSYFEKHIDNFDPNNYIQGTFLYSTWEKGSIVLNNTKVFERYMLMFNIVEKHFVAFDPEKNEYLKININNPVKEIKLGVSKFVFAQKAMGENLEIFELITGTEKTDLTLLKQHTAEFVKGKRKKKDSFIQNEVFFLQRKGQKAIEIEPKTKFVLKLLNDNAAEMKLFIKQEKLKMNKQADLKKLIEYYNLLNTDPFR